MPETKDTTTKKTPAEKPAVKKTATKTTAAVTASKTTARKASVAEPKVAKVEKKVEPKTEPVKVEKKIEAVAQPVKAPEKPAPVKVAKGKILNITLVKSGIGYSKTHKATLKALGFRRLNQTIQQVDSPSLRGMLAKVNHLVRIEEQVSK